MIESFYCNTEDVEIRFFDANGEIYLKDIQVEQIPESGV